eukprot:scaffold20139_cov38-Prasinocladus_malaysianus.AAC.1
MKQRELALIHNTGNEDGHDPASRLGQAIESPEGAGQCYCSQECHDGQSEIIMSTNEEKIGLVRRHFMQPLSSRIYCDESILAFNHNVT